VCPQKKTNPTTFIYHIVIKPQLYAVIFGSDLRDNCESAYDYVFHLICVMPIPGKTFERSYILAIKKRLKQTLPNILTVSLDATVVMENVQLVLSQFKNFYRCQVN